MNKEKDKPHRVDKDREEKEEEEKEETKATTRPDFTDPTVGPWDDLPQYIVLDDKTDREAFRTGWSLAWNWDRRSQNDITSWRPSTPEQWEAFYKEEEGPWNDHPFYILYNEGQKAHFRRVWKIKWGNITKKPNSGIEFGIGTDYKQIGKNKKRARLGGSSDEEDDDEGGTVIEFTRMHAADMYGHGMDIDDLQTRVQHLENRITKLEEKLG